MATKAYKLRTDKHVSASDSRIARAFLSGCNLYTPAAEEEMFRLIGVGDSNTRNQPKRPEETSGPEESQIDKRWRELCGMQHPLQRTR